MAPSVGQLAAGQGVAWDDLGTLNTVFPFKHLKASEDQESPTWLLNKLQQFVAALKDQVGSCLALSSTAAATHLQTTHPSHSIVKNCHFWSRFQLKTPLLWLN